MKVPTLKLKDVEAPWTRWRRQVNAFLARKQAEADALKAKAAEAQHELELKLMREAEAAAAAAAAAAAPQPVADVPPTPEAVDALTMRVMVLENAWNAFHQAQSADRRLEEILARLKSIEADYVSLDVVMDESEKLQKLVIDLGVDTLRSAMAQLRDEVTAVRRAGTGKAPVAVPADLDSLKKQLEALKLKVAAVESEDQATRAGLVALQEKQDLDEQNLAGLRKDLEMEVVADPK